MKKIVKKKEDIVMETDTMRLVFKQNGLDMEWSKYYEEIIRKNRTRLKAKAYYNAGSTTFLAVQNTLLVERKLHSS